MVNHVERAKVALAYRFFHASKDEELSKEVAEEFVTALLNQGWSPPQDGPKSTADKRMEQAMNAAREYAQEVGGEQAA